MRHDSNNNALYQPGYKSKFWDSNTQTLEGCRVKVKTSTCEDDHQSYPPANRYHTLHDHHLKKRRNKGREKEIEK
jgi:hypothetical protein